MAQQKQRTFVANGIGEIGFSLKFLSSKWFINVYITSIIVKNWLRNFSCITWYFFLFFPKFYLNLKIDCDRYLFGFLSILHREDTLPHPFSPTLYGLGPHSHVYMKRPFSLPGYSWFFKEFESTKFSFGNLKLGERGLSDFLLNNETVTQSCKLKLKGTHFARRDRNEETRLCSSREKERASHRFPLASVPQMAWLVLNSRNPYFILLY